MSAPQITLPKPVPQQRFRKPKKNIPQTVEQRNYLKSVVRKYVEEHQPTPPMPLAGLKEHADKIIQLLDCDPIYRDYIGILVNNELWRETLATVPYERRLLLLPKCLRVESRCPAPFDEFGLLCKQCGLCSIQDFQVEAERLGYAVLVAEGSAIVMSLIQTGKIDAIVGVSCISVLERAFPYMEAAAIPGVAIPLLQDDCIDTTVDLDWVWDTIHMTSDDRTRRLDLTAMRDEVEGWFTPDALEMAMGPARGRAEEIARDWLGRAGKRWRPFLTAAAYQALREDAQDTTLPEDLHKVAIAVECFHKASLIHDDIEDNDQERYGEKTLHEEHGVAVALNVGDLLIGEGYRLLASCEAPADIKARMIQAASEGQRLLCQGQGEELEWFSHSGVLSSRQVLDIFSRKTAPAFEVALRLGALYSGNHDAVADILGEYSTSLGIAYQIRDDLSDLGAQGETNDILGMRPNILAALAMERAKTDEQKSLLTDFWSRKLEDPSSAVERMEQIYTELKVDERARTLLESYKEQAVRCLAEVENPNWKGLLRRVIGKIFNDAEIKGWCSEVEDLNTLRRLDDLGPAPKPVPIS